jgi:hypothetical protein
VPGRLAPLDRLGCQQLGQTAFVEYDSTSAESEITLDVKPVATLGYSDAMLRVKGKASGTHEVPIESPDSTAFATSRRWAGALGKPNIP